MHTQSVAGSTSLRALDALNFFLADVRDGVGPYLAIYLLASRSWSAGDIGIAMASMSVATLLAQTPAGALVDAVAARRLLMGLASTVVAVACVMMTWFEGLWPVVIAQAMIGVAVAVLAPGVAAITLGLVGYRGLSRRTGRNEAFNHAGNIAAAVCAGLIGHYVAREGIFYLVAVFALFSVVSIACVKPDEIDVRLARGEQAGHDEGPGRLAALLADRRVLVLAAAVTLFHFANAAMLPLVGQYLSLGRNSAASLYMSACIIVAQLVMIPVAVAAGRLAERWGRRPVFMIGFAALPLRGVAYALSDHPVWLVAVQMLDGIGAGVFGVLIVLMVSDLTRGTGRFNVTQGALATATGLGAAASNLSAGFIVERFGYGATFCMLAGVAAVALSVFALGVPETATPVVAGPTHTR
ncbi:MFS transporter [Salinisphaera sp. T31B1]|uniref:MFS transporter n=1 Tax=Salinisphaera sp. T31B1 TaxID=727963 RepID=UPI0033420B16